MNENTKIGLRPQFRPYLQQLPRDYPIRVLAYALAFRILRKEGKLLAYEEGLNAVRIQHLGVPGL